MRKLRKTVKRISKLMKPKIKRKNTENWKHLTHMIVSKEMNFGFKFWLGSVKQRKTVFMKKKSTKKTKLKKSKIFKMVDESSQDHLETPPVHNIQISSHMKTPEHY